MTIPKLMLCYLTDNQDVIDAAHDYWDIGGADVAPYKFRLPTDAIEIKYKSRLSMSVRLAVLDNVKASIGNIVCNDCGQRRFFAGRRDLVDYLKSRQLSDVCMACRQAIEGEQRKTAINKKAEDLQLKIEAISAFEQAWVKYELDCDKLNLKVGLLALAAANVIGAGIWTGQLFMAPRLVSVWPGHFSSVVDPLTKSGLFRTAFNGNEAAYTMTDSRVSYFYTGVFLKMAELAPKNAKEIIVDRLTTPALGRATEIHSVWRQLCAMDALQYFKYNLLQHSFVMGAAAEDEVLAIFERAMERLSLSHLWCACWRVARDTVALSQRQYHSRRTALEAIPGRFVRLLADVKKERATLTKWDRHTSNPETAMFSVFDDLFGIDDQMDANDVLVALGSDSANASDSEDDDASHFEGVINLAMRVAAEADVVPLIMAAFGDSRQQGKSNYESISCAVSEVSACNQGFKDLCDEVRGRAEAQ